MDTLLVELEKNVPMYNKISQLRRYVKDISKPSITTPEAVSIVTCLCRKSTNRHVSSMIVNMILPKIQLPWRIDTMLKLVYTDCERTALLDAMYYRIGFPRLSFSEIHEIIETFTTKSATLLAFYKLVDAWTAVNIQHVMASLCRLDAANNTSTHLNARDMMDVLQFFADSNTTIYYEVDVRTVCVLKIYMGAKCEKFIQVMTRILPLWKGDKDLDEFIRRNVTCMDSCYKPPIGDHSIKLLLMNALGKYLTVKPKATALSAATATTTTITSSSSSSSSSSTKWNSNKRTKSEECSICRDNRVDRVAVPCGHAFACEKCVRELRRSSQNCSVCRCLVTQFIPLYMCGIEEEDEECAPLKHKQQQQLKQSIQASPSHVLDTLSISDAVKMLRSARFTRIFPSRTQTQARATPIVTEADN